MTGCFGQDWASFQDASPSTDGLAFVFVKATEGTGYTNPDRASQIAAGRAGGLVVGHYHYPHMAADPAAEADYFLKHAAPQADDLIVLDWEGYDDHNKNVPFSRKVAYKAAWLAHVQKARPLLQVGTYCNGDYLDQDPHGAYGDFLWIATANLAAGLPGIAHAWLFHQYSTAGGIDHDYCPLTPDELHIWAHAKETDMPLTPDDIKAVATATADAIRWYKVDNPVTPGNSQTSLGGLWWDAGNNAGHAAAGVAKLLTQPAASLTDAQLTALASKVAADPKLAAAIAEQVAAKLAARLQS